MTPKIYYRCHCGERFDLPVVHCPHCAHHWQTHETRCRNCHKLMKIKPQKTEKDSHHETL